MVYIVSGKLGSGKSFHMCRMAIEHLLKGGVVATNMALDFERIKTNYHRRLSRWQFVRVDAASDPRKIPAGDLRGSGRRRVMVILDEALNWFASSTGAKDERKSTWGEWLRQSDKLGQDVYFIAQNFERAAKWIRELAHVALRITNMGNFAVFRLPVGKWLHLQRIYVVAKYEVSSLMLIGFNTYWIEPKVWQCYATAELFGFEKPEAGYIGTVARPFKLPVWPLVPLVLLLFGILCYV